VRVRPAYHQIYLLDEGEAPAYPEHMEQLDLDRRIKAIPFLLAIYTTSDEELELDIEITSRADARDESQWEHIVEAPLAVPSGKLIIATPESYLPDAWCFSIAPGVYCVRIAGCGLKTNEQERYHVCVWPGDCASVRVIKDAGRYAA
jgi:hypothetical protein